MKRGVLFLAVVLAAPPAHAQLWTCFGDASCEARLRADYRRHKLYRLKHPELDREDRDSGALCLDKAIEVVSTEHTSEENAAEAARKLWMAKTQWLKGGQYMNLENANDVFWSCGPSNAHDTASGKLAEAASKLTGKDGQNVRCELWARPCKPARVERGK